MTIQAMFAKLIVGDEEAEAAYYTAVYGLKLLQRLEGTTDGEPFREIILAIGDDMASGMLVMFNFTARPAPRDQQAILGFMTDDIDALAARIVAYGGKLVGPIREEAGMRLVFATDPEGALTENIQMMPPVRGNIPA